MPVVALQARRAFFHCPPCRHGSCRHRADETRAKAEECWREETKQRMLRIAYEYERLADVAAERLRSDAFTKDEHTKASPHAGLP